MADLEINDDGLRVIHDEMATRLRQVDNALREASLAGHPVDDIKTQAKAALATIGLELPDEKLTEYAQSISAGDDYEFQLG
jgi:hypothetical protein